MTSSHLDTDRMKTAGERPACRHCGLPQPAAGLAPEGFCCAGCEAVYALLEAGGFGARFYDLGGGRGVPVGAVPEPQRRDWLAELLVASPSGAEVSVSLDVQGIRCAACVWLIQELWRRRDGTFSIDLNPTRGRVRLAFDPQVLDLDAFLDEIERLGYRFGPPSSKGGRRGVDRGLLARLGICAALAMNAMTFAFAVHFGLAREDGPLHGLFEGLSAVIATLAVVVGGPVFFRAAWVGLRRRALHLDLPIALGILLAWGGSLHAWWSGSGANYFDTVTVFVALMLGGRFLQGRAVERNRDLVLENDGIEHLRARRLAAPSGDSEFADSAERQLELVPVHAIRAGDELVAAPGDLVPVEAELVGVRSARFSLDWIRGESEPREFVPGAVVPAGAFCASDRAVRLCARTDVHGSGLVDLLATPDADDSAAKESLRGRAAHGFWLRLNRVYVTLVLGLAGLAAAVWSVLDPSRALDVTVSVLVVTCPCALGIATPLAFDLILAGLRRRGIYVRTQGLLEKARHVRRVLLDKTGTLTWGGLRVETLRRPSTVESRDVLATMAASSNHPVSRAVLADMESGPLAARFLEDLEVEEVPGQGLRATRTDADGHEVVYLFGSRRFVLGDSAGSDHLARASSVVLLSRDGHVEACFAVDEDYRPGLSDEVDWLRADGIDVHLLSGDHQAKVVRAAERLGVPIVCAHGDLSPEQKAAIVTELDRDDTMMVGDGLNDAKAFDAAWCAGTPALDRAVMPARADFFYAGASGIDAIRHVLVGARGFHAVVRTNLLLAGIYNVGAVALCFAGVMTPLLCAVAMPASSLALIAHTVARLSTSDRAAPSGPRHDSVHGDAVGEVAA